MKESTRNLVIGATVLISLVILASMAILFQDLPGFLRTGYAVKVAFPNTGGVSRGAEVQMAGKRIGRVTNVTFVDPNDPAKGVLFEMDIDRAFTLPGKVNIYTTTHGLVGGVGVEARLDDRPPGNLRTMATLPKDGSAYIQGAVESGAGGLLPAEVVTDARDALQGITRLSARLDTFLTPPPALSGQQPAASAPAGDATATAPASAPTQPNIYVTMGKLDTALNAVNTILGDKETQANFKSGVANFSRAAGGVDQLAVKLIDDADKLGGILSTLQAAAIKLEQGEGTFGKLLNDAKLYNSMVDAAVQLKGALAQLQGVLEQWKHGGVAVKLK